MGTNKLSGNPKLMYECNFVIDKACILFRGGTINTKKCL